MRNRGIKVVSCAVILLIFGTAVLSGAVNLPDTGQAACYGETGTVIPCSGTGQDGEFAINPKSFSDNGDGTVTDDNTGLVWQVEVDSTVTKWDAAVNYCNSLALAGSDWRLPNIEELDSIIDETGYDPSLDTAFLGDARMAGYWSSTSDATSPQKALFVRFDSGVRDSSDKSVSLGVLCVRGSRNAATTSPNLTPYKPATWSGKIVVSKTTGSHTDSSLLYTTNTLYIDWAVLNNGSAATAGVFSVALYVDGVKRVSWNVNPPLNSNYYTSVSDYSIGSLSAGTHKIKLVADATGTIAESNESDNAYTRTITVVSNTSNKPNLLPYKPATWSDKIVVSKTTGTTTDSGSLYTTDTLYVDCAMANLGNAATAATFYTYLYVDGVLKRTGTRTTPLAANTYASFTDYSIGSLSAGTHTIKFVADPTGAIAESNESDNAYTKTITVNGDCINDPYTGLCWDTKNSSTLMVRDDAIAYCTAKGARMPTINELITFATAGDISQNPFDGGNGGYLYGSAKDLRPPLVARGFEFNGSSYLYCSSTPNASNSYWTWYMTFDAGSVDNICGKAIPFNVRCVRSGQ